MHTRPPALAIAFPTPKNSTHANCSKAEDLTAAGVERPENLEWGDCGEMTNVLMLEPQWDVVVRMSVLASVLAGVQGCDVSRPRSGSSAYTAKSRGGGWGAWSLASDCNLTE